MTRRHRSAPKTACFGFVAPSASIVFRTPASTRPSSSLPRPSGRPAAQRAEKDADHHELGVWLAFRKGSHCFYYNVSILSMNYSGRFPKAAPLRDGLYPKPGKNVSDYLIKKGRNFAEGGTSLCPRRNLLQRESVGVKRYLRSGSPGCPWRRRPAMTGLTHRRADRRRRYRRKTISSCLAKKKYLMSAWRRSTFLTRKTPVRLRPKFR
ncbi:hypothetical protein SAMN05444581_13511 [Methylocapsa palsarum]|uniref:Uncharacterized protein n=1 Tax=Methylocapsa palsarum TaxID=1612308 RepID=A0A1I4D0X5_9HYPH|nr:hypothetical protein SAMN05444581_13511 [Methylocapsa palsarum]